MEMSKGKLYRLTELKHMFVIGDKDVVVPSKDARPLIIADTATMIDYLSRYLYARSEEGKGYREAHDIALGYVGITQKIKPERVL